MVSSWLGELRRYKSKGKLSRSQWNDLQKELAWASSEGEYSLVWCLDVMGVDDVGDIRELVRACNGIECPKRKGKWLYPVLDDSQIETLCGDGSTRQCHNWRLLGYASPGDYLYAIWSLASQGYLASDIARHLKVDELSIRHSLRKSVNILDIQLTKQK